MTRETSRISRQPGKPAAESVLALNGRSVASRGVVTPFLDRAQAKDGIRNAPSFLYSEDRPGAIFGFYHIEALTARSNPEERQAGLHRHPDFDQLLILATGTCLFEHDGQKREVEAPCCVYTPANVVHQFSYGPDATGVVISVSSDFVAGLSSAEQSAITTMLRLGTQRVIKFRTDETTAAARALIDLTLEKFASRHPHRCDIVRYLFGGLLLELAAALDVPSHWDTRTVNAIDIFRQYRDLIQETIGAIGFSDDPPPASNTVEFVCEPPFDDAVCAERRLSERVRMFRARPHSYGDTGTGDAASPLHDAAGERDFVSSGVFPRLPLHAILQAAPRRHDSRSVPKQGAARQMG